MPTYISKSCRHCNVGFSVLPRNKNQRYCSQECHIESIKNHEVEISCVKCRTKFNTKNSKKRYCSRTCANSRGPRSDEFKSIVSKKNKGKKLSAESILKGILSKGQIPNHAKSNTTCEVCRKDTASKTRKTCSKECYLIYNKKTSQLHPRCGGQKHTHRSTIDNIAGESYIVESSYELILAQDLNRNNILWVRPKYMNYIDSNGNLRRYHPDFYLPDYDVYLDPKNDYLIKTDIDKINRAVEYNQIKILILDRNHLKYDTFRSLVEDDGYAPPSPACKTGVFLLN
jgi:hypothetical protein